MYKLLKKFNMNQQFNKKLYKNFSDNNYKLEHKINLIKPKEYSNYEEMELSFE